MTGRLSAIIYKTAVVHGKLVELSFTSSNPELSPVLLFSLFSFAPLLFNNVSGVALATWNATKSACSDWRPTDPVLTGRLTRAQQAFRVNGWTQTIPEEGACGGKAFHWTVDSSVANRRYLCRLSERLYIEEESNHNGRPSVKIVDNCIPSVCCFSSSRWWSWRIFIQN